LLNGEQSIDFVSLVRTCCRGAKGSQRDDKMGKIHIAKIRSLRFIIRDKHILGSCLCADNQVMKTKSYQIHIGVEISNCICQFVNMEIFLSFSWETHKSLGIRMKIV